MALGFTTGLRADDAGLLLRWPAHEGTGSLVRDTSSNRLDGVSAAGWADVNGVKALQLDGQPESVVRVQLPPDRAIGTGDWSFMAWLRPDVLGFPGPQDQRRIFSYGKYPEASMNLDLTGRGMITWYLVYRDGGTNVSAGGSSSPRFKEKSWVHTALVVNRHSGEMTIYLNGMAAGAAHLPAGWNGNFNLDNQLTLGAAWQNYHGAVADVSVWRRALSEAEVKAAFRDQVRAYHLKPGDDLTLEEWLNPLAESGNAAMSQLKTVEARTHFRQMIATPGVPPGWAAWAELRIAQSYRLERNDAAARATYTNIEKSAAYPAHLRQEAGEVLLEMERLAAGLAARDITASRTVMPPIDKFAAEIWLSPDGNDANPGTAGQPVATLQRARDLIRAQKTRVHGPVAVLLKSGEYPLSAGLTLTARDSGTANAPVVWKAEQPGQAILYGGTRLKGFTPVTDEAVLARLPAAARGHVVKCNLQAQGITDYGALAVRGFGQPTPPPTLELYVNQQPMTLARWPNSGFVAATKVIESGDKKAGRPSVLGYEGDRPASWTQAEDGWIFGYFHYLWADATARLGKIDPVAKTLTTALAYEYGGQGMINEQGIIYYAFNLLEELDQSGEWYLDRNAGTLYLYPPGDLQTATVELSRLNQPMLAGDDLTNVRFEGLVFDLACGDGIVLNNSSDCLLAGCTVRRIAGNGISLLGGERDTLLSCDVHTIGRTATRVLGGDRATLTPGCHLVANCRIHDFGRIDRTYTPGVQLEGVANRVAHNLFYDCPSSVMRVEGNDHLIEFNDVRHAVLESDDQGAMELFGNPSYRGVIFRDNSFRDIGSGTSQKLMHGQAGIRLDDAISGMLVYRNIFYRAANGRFGGVQINSGRDNVMDNNIFVECAQGISGGYNPGNHVWKSLREGRQPQTVYTTELYQQRYPLMATMLQEPAVNHTWRNIFYQCNRDFSSPARLDRLANDFATDRNPGFVDPAHGNLRLQPDAPVINAIGFRPIPVDEIGLYPDAWRAPPRNDLPPTKL